MNAMPSPIEVRHQVLATLRQYDAAIGAEDLKEIIFLADGKCLARAYRGGAFSATWLLEEGQLQFFDAAGKLLRTDRLTISIELRRAA